MGLKFLDGCVYLALLFKLGIRTTTGDVGMNPSPWNCMVGKKSSNKMGTKKLKGENDRRKLVGLAMNKRDVILYC